MNDSIYYCYIDITFFFQVKVKITRDSRRNNLKKKKYISRTFWYIIYCEVINIVDFYYWLQVIVSFFRDILKKREEEDRQVVRSFLFYTRTGFSAFLRDSSLFLPPWQRVKCPWNILVSVEKRMEWKLNPYFDIELSALKGIRRNSFVGRKGFKCRSNA